jgi:hypothetical protein
MLHKGQHSSDSCQGLRQLLKTGERKKRIVEFSRSYQTRISLEKAIRNQLRKNDAKISADST